MNRSILGLDIRHRSVSAVLLKKGIRDNRVEAFAHVLLPEGSGFPDGIREALESVFQEVDAHGALCVTALPAGDVSFRNLKVPFKEQKKIRQILPFELETTLPRPVEELVIDFQAFRSGDQTDLVAATVETTRLQSYLEMLQAFPIEPGMVTAGGFPTALCLARMGKIPENLLLVEADTDTATLLVISSGDIRMVRSLPFSQDDATGAAQALCFEIRRTMTAFEESIQPEFSPEAVYITGPSTEQTGLEEEMAEILRLPVKAVDLGRDLTHVVLDRSQEDWNPHRMNGALALALVEAGGFSGFNFRRGTFSPRKSWEEHRRSLIPMAAMAAAILCLALANGYMASSRLEKKVTSLDRQITEAFRSTFPEVTRIVDPLQQMRVRMEEVRKNMAVPGEMESNVRQIDILNRISRQIPEKIDVVITNMVTAPGNVQISGDTDTFNSVDEMKGQLEKEDLFKKVTISSANMERGENRVRFKLRIEL